MGSQPFTSTYDAFNGYIYVISEKSRNVSILSGTQLIGSVPVGSSPGFGTADPKNGYVYVPVGLGNVTGQVVVINGSTIVGTISVGSVPWSATYDAGNGYIYVTNFNSSNVTIIDGTRVIASVGVGPNPAWAAYDPRNGFVYVTCFGFQGAGGVSILNGSGLVTNLQVGSPVYFPVFDDENGFVYVTAFGTGFPTDTVLILNGTSIIGAVNVGRIYTIAEHDLAYDSLSGLIYVANYDSGNVSVIAGTRLVGSVPVGNEPSSVAFDSLNGCLFVSNNASDNVSVIRGMAVIESVPVGSGPASVTYDPRNGNVYVTNPNSNNVSVIFALYEVLFEETGLPNSTGWAVGVDGMPPLSSHASELWSLAVAGTHSYALTTLNRSFSGRGGTFVVSGAPATVAVDFSLVTYPVTFEEIGLPPGSGWSVDLAGIRGSSEGVAIVLPVANGTYTYRVGDFPGWQAESTTGAISVDGSPTSVSIGWSRVTYAITFAEAGLPASSTWTVAFNGTFVQGSGSIQMFGIPNGSFPFQIVEIRGFQAIPDHGTITVSGGKAYQPVLFEPEIPVQNAAAPPTFHGLTGTGWTLTGLGLLASTVVLVLALRRRRRPKSAGSDPVDSRAL